MGCRSKVSCILNGIISTVPPTGPNIIINGFCYLSVDCFFLVVSVRFRAVGCVCRFVRAF
jgi:hypothetical protein